MNKHIDFLTQGVWFLAILLLSSIVVKAEESSDKWLIRINNRVVTLDEYLYLYKNNEKSSSVSSEGFINQLTDFILLSSQAKLHQLDTLPTYLQKMKAYQDNYDRQSLLSSASMQSVQSLSKPSMKLSLLLIKLPQQLSMSQQKQTEALMDSLYVQLQQGMPFQVAVDKYSAYKQPLFVRKTQISTELLEVIDTLDEGDYSSPFYEPQGICIVKLHQRDIQEKRMNKQLLDSVLSNRVEALKTELGFSCDEVAKKELLSNKKTNKILFHIENRSYQMSDFSRFSNQFPMDIQRQWEAFERWAILNYYFEQLHQTKDYRFNLQHKSDSLLVTIFQESIAIPSPSDDELNNFFQKHKKEYAWKEKRFKGIVMQSDDKKLLKSVRKWLKKLPYEEWQDALQMVINKDEIRVLSTQQLFSRGDNPFVDELVFKSAKATAHPLFPYVEVLGKRLKMPDDFNLVRNNLLDDFLREKHRRLMEQLRASANIEINEEVLKTVNSLNSIN